MEPRTALQQWLAEDNPERRGKQGRLLQGTSPDRYGDDVGSWLDFLDLLDLSAWEASGSHVRTWLDSRRGAVRSRARRVSALSAFYTYAMHKGYASHSPAHPTLRGHPHDEPGLQLLTLSQAMTVQHAADRLGTPTAARDRLLVYLMLSGLRPRQITELDLRDFHFEQQRLTADVWQKGGGTRLTELPRVVEVVLTAYLPHRVHVAPHSYEQRGPVLTTYRGQRLDVNQTPRNVLRAVIASSALCAKARVPSGLKPDALAHSPSPLKKISSPDTPPQVR